MLVTAEIFRLRMGIWVLCSVDHTTRSSGQVPETWYKRQRPQHKKLEFSSDLNGGRPKRGTATAQALHDGWLLAFSGHSKHDGGVWVWEMDGYIDQP